MAGRNMFSTEKVKQKGAKAIYYTFWCHSPYRNNEIRGYSGYKIINKK